MKLWQGIVIHHSASPDVSANVIDDWHKERGWKEIGYHFVIREDGSLEPARSFEDAGAHALGRNSTHLGVCLTGHLGEHPPTVSQRATLLSLVKGLMSRYDIPWDKVERHHEQCPGYHFEWDTFVETLKELNIDND